jgi:hypothetical protein
MNLYRVEARGTESGVWMVVAQVIAESYEGAIKKARVGQCKDWAHFKAVLIANQSGHRLGRFKEVRFAEPLGLRNLLENQG